MVPTPHIEAKLGEIAKTVLMPGDPLRAKFIAETFLENPKQYNSVRGMLGFTGTYKGKEISVQGSGMGVPSMAIYSYELFKFYDVDNIIRVGTAGAMQEHLKIGDIVFAQGASTNSNFQNQFEAEGIIAPIASYELLSRGVEVAKEMGVNYDVGNVLTSDTFYDANPRYKEMWTNIGTLCVEMEAAGLYLNAAQLGKRALALFTMSDSLVTGEVTTAEQREKNFTDMMEIALETGISF